MYLLFLNPFPGSLGLNLLDLAMSLVDTGTVELTRHTASDVDVAVRNGRVLSGLPPGGSFIAALVYLLARPLLGFVPAESRLTVLYALCSVLVCIPAAMVTVYLVYRTAMRWGASGRAAFLTAGLLACGTMQFGYATGFYKKTLATACLMGAFTLLLPQTGEKLRSARTGLAGILCSLAIGQDYPTAVIAAALGGYLLWCRPGVSALLSFAIGAGCAMLPLLLYHQAAFGSPWATAYRFRPDPLGNTLGFPRPGPFLFLLVTLLAASPCLIWSAIGWARAVRMPRLRGAMVTLAVGVVGTLLLISGWATFYPHEASFASRLLLPMIPFAVLPMAFGVPETRWGVSLAVIVWSIGATLLAAQAALIPSNTLPPIYALKVLGTSWGTGPLFSELVAAWLPLPTLHLLIARQVATSEALLQPAQRTLLLHAVWGQALIKASSLLTTALAGFLLWRFVWKPVVHVLPWSRAPRLSPTGLPRS